MSSNGQTTLSSFYNITNASTNPTTNTKLPDDASTFLLQRLKSMSDRLPRVDEDGLPYKFVAGESGRKAVKNRQQYTNRELQSIFNEYPHRPLQIVTDPRVRAASKRVGTFWTQQTMEQAAMEFCIPAGLRVCFVCPELWDRDLLQHHDQFKKPNGGVMAPCLKCNSNLYMTQSGWTTSRLNVQRTINKEMAHDVVIGAAYVCRNPSTCVRVKNKRKVYQSFTVYTHNFWSQYPDLVRQRYLDYTSGVDDRSTQVMLSPGLLDRLLFYTGTFEDFSRELNDSVTQLARSLETHYYSFVREESTKFATQPRGMNNDTYSRYRNLKWPRFNMQSVMKSFKMPTPNTVQKMFHDGYESIEDHLLRDLLTRLPGRILRKDGTFDIMKKTMNCVGSEYDNIAHVKILGEYGHIITYAFCDAETNVVTERLLFYLKKRMNRLGARLGCPNAVDKVVAVYDDICCNNGDPKKNFVRLLFPNCKRAPLKDVWHGVQIPLRETQGYGHDLHDEFTRRLWRLMLKWDRTTMDIAVTHFMKNHPDGLLLKTKEAAIEPMMKHKRYRDSINNYIRRGDAFKTANDVMQLYTDTEKVDNDLAEEAKMDGRGYKRYFKKHIPGIQIGSKKAIENLCDHIRKGCFADPLPPHEMSYIASGDPPTDGGPPRKRRRRGTNVVESNNRFGAQRAIGKSRRQASTLTQRKFLLFCLEHNLKCDARIQHITGRPPLSRDWFIREALYRSVCHLVHSGTDELYPPDFDRKLHMEPIGEWYQLHQEWENMTRALKIHYEYQRTVRKIKVPFTCCPCLADQQHRTIDRSDQIAVNDEAAALNLPTPPPPPSDLATPPTNLPTPPSPTAAEAPPTANLPTSPPTAPPPPSDLATPPPNLPTPPSPTQPLTSPDVFGDTSFLDDFDVDAVVANRTPPQKAPPTDLPTPSPTTAVAAPSPVPPLHPPPHPPTHPPPHPPTHPPAHPPTHPPPHPPALVYHYQQYLQQLDGPGGGVGDDQARFSRRLHNHNIGYSAASWGNRGPPASTSTLDNTYIQRGKLTQLQSDELDKAVSDVQHMYGPTLTIPQRNELIANLFNTRHLAAGGVGFGGKISPKRVETEGRQRAQSMKGSRIPGRQLFYPPTLTEADLEVGQKKLRDLCKRHNLSQFGASTELRSRLRSRFNLPDPSTPGPSTPGPSTPGPSTPGPSTPGPPPPGPPPPIDPYDLTELRGTAKKGDDEDVSEFF